jgi:hypothetical protein
LRFITSDGHISLPLFHRGGPVQPGIRNEITTLDEHADLARPLHHSIGMENPAKVVTRGDVGRGPGVDLEPETILPSQYFSGVDIDASLQPEKRLMLAVLEDAVGTFQKYVNARDRRAQAVFVETEEWFSAEEGEWPFSFRNICQALGLETEFIRRGLWQWRDRQRAKAESAPNVIRFPFRRVNGSRHSITGRPVGLRRSA